MNNYARVIGVGVFVIVIIAKETESQWPATIVQIMPCAAATPVILGLVRRVDSGVFIVSGQSSCKSPRYYEVVVSTPLPLRSAWALPRVPSPGFARGDPPPLVISWNCDAMVV